MLSRNIAYTEAYDKDELVRVVLVDYATGDAYYVTMPAEIARISIKKATEGCPLSPDGIHKFTIATCVDDSKCIYCQAHGREALGHDFADATCEEPQRCKRCGLEHGEKLGHLYVRNADITDSSVVEKFTNKNLILVRNNDGDIAWVTDAVKHWHECIRCGAKEGEETHSKGFVDVDSVYHEEICTVCGWTSAKIAHIFDKPVSTNKDGEPRDNMHIVKCKTCGEVVEHREVVPPEAINSNTWFGDHDEVHYRICSVAGCPCNDYLTVTLNGVTKGVAFKENHIDLDHDSICDICGKNKDYNPPAEFTDEDAGAYAKVINTTTESITIEAYTVDKERQVSYYEFGMYDEATNTINWDTDHPVYVNSSEDKAVYKFTDLQDKKTYTMYVRATDDNGNTNMPYKVMGTTSRFPDFAGLIDWPENGHGEYRAPGWEVKVKEIDTDLTDIRLSYYQNGTWIKSGYENSVPLDAIQNIVIRLERDNLANSDNKKEELKFKFVDKNGNESREWEFETDRIDAQPPVITIESKESTNEQSQLKHNALIVISDSKSGIEQDTVVRYAWSNSNTTAPADNAYTTIHTQNLETASRVTYEVQTPAGVNDTYYLWVDKGVVDKVGNASEAAYCGKTTPFIVDDTTAELTDITMLDVNPAVPGEVLFVKTDGIVTITFNANKPLAINPVVRINGVNVDTITSNEDKTSFTCTIKIVDSFAEGTLQLTIAEVMTKQGKLSDRVYTNADIANGQGPVYYDKTFPVMEYDPKTNH